MVSNARISELSSEERAAWMASLNEDETIILHTANGRRYVLVAIAECKWFLSHTIPAEYRLKFLEFIDRHTDLFTPEALALLEPMNNEGREMLKEARKLGSKWLDVVSSWEVFNAFVALNPSMLVALKMPEPSGYKFDQQRRN
jgi:hypothetical protein